MSNKERIAELEAACAEKDAALERIAGFAPGNGDVCEIIARRARAALSPDCGRRYARIVEAAERLDSIETRMDHDEADTSDWAAAMTELRAALADKEPTAD